MRCSLRAPEKTSKRPGASAASISTSAGSSKYSTPLAATPTPTLPTQATPGQCARSAAHSASAWPA